MQNTLPAVDDTVYIPQHPKGRDLELAIFENHPVVSSGLCTVKTNGQGVQDRTCTLYGAGFKDFVTFCDTEGGSSGSPVLSTTSNKVVGIHHCGSSCENFAIPIIHIYSAVIGLINSDIASAVQPVSTGAPSLAPSSSLTPTDGTTPSSCLWELVGLNEKWCSAAGSTLVPYSFVWLFGLVLWMVTI